MRVFVTGASGWIGSAVTKELLANGHQVLGLARSDASAERVAALGAEVHRGDLNDVESLAAGAAGADGVIHLGYHHDFSQMTEAAQLDRAAIDTFGRVLEGTDKPLLMASGIVGLSIGRAATEEDEADPVGHPRIANAQAALALADRGVRSIVVRFPPTVHGDGDYGFVAALVGFARENGVSGYIGDGGNRWPAVHRLDAAKLLRLALESAPAGTVVHAIAEEGVPAKAIAESVGRGLGLPTGPVAPEALGWLGTFFALDAPTSSTITRERFSWEPTHPTLLEDLDAGAYTAS
jgi:nucleoside-diphosphate-sugar epimerase